VLFYAVNQNTKSDNGLNTTKFYCVKENGMLGYAIGRNRFYSLKNTFFLYLDRYQTLPIDLLTKLVQKLYKVGPKKSLIFKGASREIVGNEWR